MPVYEVPEDAGPFVVVRGKSGDWAVAEAALAEAGKVAAKLGAVFIPCRDEAQAEEVAAKLNAGEHDGQVRVDLL